MQNDMMKITLYLMKSCVIKDVADDFIYTIKKEALIVPLSICVL